MAENKNIDLRLKQYIENVKANMKEQRKIMVHYVKVSKRTLTTLITVLKNLKD